VQREGDLQRRRGGACRLNRSCRDQNHRQPDSHVVPPATTCKGGVRRGPYGTGMFGRGIADGFRRRQALPIMGSRTARAAPPAGLVTVSSRERLWFRASLTSSPAAWQPLKEETTP
jgi:hypothetical protein